MKKSINNQSKLVLLSLTIAMSSLSFAKKDIEIEYMDTPEIIEEVSDNIFLEFVDGDVVDKSSENLDIIEYKVGKKGIGKYAIPQDEYGIVANNITSMDNDYIISSKVFELDGMNDSLEPFNRRMYAFNTQLDRKVLYPVSRVYGAIVPRPVRTGISNFFSNFKEIPTFVNSLLQLKPKKAVNALGRFAVNSTVGVLGLMDPATKFGMKKDVETMGDTFGHYGMGSGSYLMLPVLGPSSIRDGIGTAVDTAVEGAAREAIFEKPALFDHGVNETAYGFSRTVVTGLNARSLIGFQYGDLNSPFEYDLVRAFYYNMRKLQIKK